MDLGFPMNALSPLSFWSCSLYFYGTSWYSEFNKSTWISCAFRFHHPPSRLMAVADHLSFNHGCITWPQFRAFLSRICHKGQQPEFKISLLPPYVTLTCISYFGGWDFIYEFFVILFCSFFPPEMFILVNIFKLGGQIPWNQKPCLCTFLWLATNTESSSP